MARLPAILTAVAVCLYSSTLCADTIRTLLHPGPACPPDTPVLVSFGFPLPRDYLEDPQAIRVLDEEGQEIPANVLPLLPWRNLMTGEDTPALRSVLVQFYRTFPDEAPLPVVLQTHQERQAHLDAPRDATAHWVRVDDQEYPGAYQVFEPPVYVTLPPSWLGKCAIKVETVPYGTFKEFLWNDTLMINDNPRWHSGQNFFRTLINDVPGLDEKYAIKYLEPGNHEPWLFDRAMTLYTIYVRSGRVEVLRAAHRAAFFYASRLDSRGFFTLRHGSDLKYTYGEPLITDFLFFGDPRMVEHLHDICKAAAGFNPVYQSDRSHGLWTERHLAFAWLAFITAYEGTGEPAYGTKAREFADAIFKHQENPPVHKQRGQAPNDGALMHSMVQHEGWHDDRAPYWMFSPFMTAVLVDAMERYHLHSGDPRVLYSAKRFGDAIIDIANQDHNLKGQIWTIPAYVASSEKNWTDGGHWVDREHALEVAKITAFAYYCSVLEGNPDMKYYEGTRKLLQTADRVLNKWIRPGGIQSGNSIYRLNPPRKGNWWFRITSNLDLLLADQLTKVSEPGTGIAKRLENG